MINVHWTNISYRRLFRQYFLLLFVSQMASGLFRFIAAAGRNMIVANTFGAFALLMLLALGGFILSHGMMRKYCFKIHRTFFCMNSNNDSFCPFGAADNVKKWWIWGYWSSPLMYAQNAIVVNEFLGKSWSKVSSRIVYLNVCISVCVSVSDDRMHFQFAECY